MGKVKGIVRALFAESVYCVCVSHDGVHFEINPLDWKTWYADPVLLQYDGKNYVLTEVMDRFRQIGGIGVSEITGNKVSRPQMIIREPFHMSFPAVFERNGTVYMLPETSAVHELRIYKMGNTVYDWKLEKTIPDVEIVDVSILQRDDKIFLFGSEVLKTDMNKTRLIVYRFDWDNTELIPVWRDEEYTYSSRNGGMLLEYDDVMMRVAQESTKEQYGRNVCLYEVERFDGDSYREKLAKRITVDELQFSAFGRGWKPRYMHTYEKQGDLTVIDVNTDHYSLLVPFQKAIRVLYRRIKVA